MTYQALSWVVIIDIGKVAPNGIGSANVVLALNKI